MSRAVLAEFRTLGILVAPIVATQLSQMGMGVADAVMAGRVGPVDLAGVTLGGTVYFPLMLLLMGIVMAVTPSVSQLHGAGRVADAGAVVRQALWIALISGAVLAVVLRNVEPVYRLLGVDERAIPVAVGYLGAISLGLVPLLAYVVLRCLAEGLSLTWPAMCIGMSALAIKVPLNWLFIYGQPKLGIPAMGGVGCGWATAIVMTYTLSAMVTVVSLSRIRASNVFAAFSPPRMAEIAKLLRLGVPIGLTLFLEVGFFSFVTLLIGRLGAEVVASHQIAFNVGGVAFMIPLALGMAATIRVGYNVGADNLPAARMSAWVAVTTTLVWGLLVAVVMMVFRHQIAGFYSEDSEVVQVAAGLLLIGALFQVFDASQATALGALRGYKDVRAPMLIAVVAYWVVGLPAGALLCFGYQAIAPMGVHGFWWGLVIGLAAAALALLTRLRLVSQPVVDSASGIAVGRS